MNTTGNSLRTDLDLKITLFLALFVKITPIKCGLCVSVETVRNGGIAYRIAAVVTVHSVIPCVTRMVIVLF